MLKRLATPALKRQRAKRAVSAARKTLHLALTRMGVTLTTIRRNEDSGEGFASWVEKTIQATKKRRGKLASAQCRKAKAALEELQRLEQPWVVGDFALSDQDVERSQTVPLCLEGRMFLYDGSVYEADLGLTPHDIVALASEAENRKRLRLERAHALLAMRQALDSSTRRLPIPQEVKLVVWNRDGGRCVQCDSQNELEFDHIIPLALGGSNTDRNLQLLCAQCNRRKGASLG